MLALSLGEVGPMVGLCSGEAGLAEGLWGGSASILTPGTTTKADENSTKTSQI
jgi:hypothetical protein